MTADAVNPVTGSPKVAVTGMGDVTAGVAASGARVTVGAAESTVRRSTADGGVAFPAASPATPGAMLAVTGPSAVGTRSKEYELPAPRKLLTVPFVTTTADAVNPVTGSLKVAVTGM